jgi:hypothetical protein
MPENAHPCTAADVTRRIVITMSDADRLELLDRIADRVPGLDLDEHEIEWTTYPDGAQALMIDGGGMDGGTGFTLSNCGNDVHAVGTLAPLIPAISAAW